METAFVGLGRKLIKTGARQILFVIKKVQCSEKYLPLHEL